MWFHTRSRRSTQQNNRLSERVRRSAFEALEARQMLTVSASIVAGNVVFIDDSSGIVDTTLTLGVAANQDLVWAANGSGFTSDLDTSAPGTQALQFSAINDINFFFGVGNDTLVLSLGNFQFDAQLSTAFGGPSQNSSINLSSPAIAAGSDINFRGLELLEIDGDSDDNLIVSTGFGDSNFTIKQGPRGDRLGSDIYPPIDYLNLASLKFTEGGSATSVNEIRIATSNLFNDIPIEIDLGNEDTVIIEGSNSLDDSWFLLRTTGGDLTITDQTSTRKVTLVDDNAGVNLVFRGLGGDDLVNMAADTNTGNDIIRTPITFDGGADLDQMLVVGVPTTAVDEAIYTAQTTSNGVNLRYEDAANALLASVDLVNVEGITDQLQANRATIIGTNGVDNLSYGPGDTFSDAVVSVSRHATYRFLNKATATLNGSGGNDVFNIDNSAKTAALDDLTQLVVNGGPNSGYDRIIVSNMGKKVVATKTAITAGGFLPIAYSRIDRLRFDRGTLADVSALIKLVGASGPSFGFPTVNRTLTFKNKSAISVEGSFVAVFTVPAGVSVDNATGTTQFFKPGKKFIRFNIGAGRLEPSTEIALNVRFRFANAMAANNFKSQGFTVDLLAGNGAA